MHSLGKKLCLIILALLFFVSGIIIAINSVAYQKGMREELIVHEMPSLFNDIVHKTDDAIMEPARMMLMTGHSPILQDWVRNGEPNGCLDEIYGLFETLASVYKVVSIGFVSAHTFQYTNIVEGVKDSAYHVTKEKDHWFFDFQDSGVPVSIYVYTGDPVWGTKAFINTRVEVDGEFAGIFFCSVDIRDFAKQLSTMTIGNSGCTFVADQNGKMHLHPDTKIVNKVITDVYSEYVSIWPELQEKAGTKNRYRTSFKRDGDTRQIIAGKIPVLDWYLISEASENEFMQGVRQSAITSIAISLLLLIFAGFIGIMVIHNIVNPLRQTAEYATRISQGELDQKLNIVRKDEIGVLAHALRNMVANLQQKIQDAEEHGKVMQSQAEAAEKARREGEALRKKTDALLKTAQHEADEVADISHTIGAASQNLQKENREIADGADQQFEYVRKTAEEIKSMIDRFQNIMDSTDAAVSSLEKAHSKATAGQDKVSHVIAANENVSQLAEAMRKSMNDLDQQTDNISRILNLITDIADQTNLLALNAAIEAARAGEAGKGFAVVADEVRKLAEKTMHATDDVAATIDHVKKSAADNIANMEKSYEAVHSASQLAEDSGDALREIVQFSEENSGLVKNIAAIASELVRSTTEIKETMGNVSMIAQNTRDGMGKSSDIVKSLVKQTARLNALIDELKKH